MYAYMVKGKHQEGDGCVWGSSSRCKVGACKENEGYAVYIDVKGVNVRQGGSC